VTWDERKNEAKKSKHAYWNKLAITLVDGKELSLRHRQQLE